MLIDYSLAAPDLVLYFNDQMLQDSTLNEQIKKLNDQIDVQNNCNSTLYNQAQEMAHTIPQGHPSIAKIQWTSVHVEEMVVLRKQLVDTFQTINDTSDPDQLVYFTST